jgi:hypothetical protein
MTQTKTSGLAFAAAWILAIALSPLGCSSSSDNNPTPSSGGAPATGGTSSTAGNANTAGTAGQGTCTLDPTDQCYKSGTTCDPKTMTSTELLDQCTSASCSHYDNSALPTPLPAIP